MTRTGQQLYVSTKLSRRLYWLTQLELFRPTDGRILTREDVMEKLLNEKIEHDFPNMLALEKRMDALEKQFLGELLNPTVKPNEKTNNNNSN